MSFPVHAALELTTASVLIGAPFALGLSVDATITAVVIGTVLLGLAISGTATEGRGTLPLSAHAAYDAGIALVLVGAAIYFGLSGQAGALAFLLAAGTAQLVLNAVTRYSPVRT